MGIPYMSIAVLAVVLVTFYRIGELDDEIGSPLGLATGVLVVGLCLVVSGGVGQIVLFAVGGFVLLTIYKIVRSGFLVSRRAREKNAEQQRGGHR